MGFLDDIFNKTDPGEVYKITAKGLITIINKWVKNVDDLGMSNRLNEFLTDDYTIGFLVGFIGYISENNNINDKEIFLGILGSSIREGFAHIMTPDESYNLFNDKIESYIGKLAHDSNDDKPSSGGRLVADLYLKSSDRNYYLDKYNNKIRMSPDQWASGIAGLPISYSENN